MGASLLLYEMGPKGGGGRGGEQSLKPPNLF